MTAGQIEVVAGGCGWESRERDNSLNWAGDLEVLSKSEVVMCFVIINKGAVM